MSEVRMEIPTDSLLKLPEGSSFHAKSGQARLDIGKGKEPGTIVVYASCDSLQRQCEYYDWTIEYYISCKNGNASKFVLNVEWSGEFKSRATDMTEVLKVQIEEK